MTLTGLHYIELGIVKLNGVRVHEGMTEYTPSTFQKWRSRYALTQQPIVHVSIGGEPGNYFRCSSPEVVSSMLEDLAQSIECSVNDEGSLKLFDIDSFSDRNRLVKWPLSQIVAKSPHLEVLKIARLGGIAENRS